MTSNLYSGLLNEYPSDVFAEFAKGLGLTVKKSRQDFSNMVPDQAHDEHQKSKNGCGYRRNFEFPINFIKMGNFRTRNHETDRVGKY